MSLVGAFENKVILTGVIGHEPAIHYKEAETCVATLSVGIENRSTITTADQKLETSNLQWHTIKAFNTLAQFVEQELTKGMLIQVTGSLHYQLQRANGSAGLTDARLHKAYYIIAKDLRIIHRQQCSSHDAHDSKERKETREAHPLQHTASNSYNPYGKYLEELSSGEEDPDLPF